MKADFPSESAQMLAGSTGGNAELPDGTPLLLSAQQAATALGLGTRTVWSYTKREAIPSLRIGRRVMYRPSELRAWLDLGALTEPGSAARVRKAVRP